MVFILLFSASMMCLSTPFLSLVSSYTHVRHHSVLRLADFDVLWVIVFIGVELYGDPLSSRFLVFDPLAMGTQVIKSVVL